MLKRCHGHSSVTPALLQNHVTSMQCIGTSEVVHVQSLGVLLTLMLPPVPTLPRMTPCSLTLNWFPPETIPSGLFTCEEHPAISSLMKENDAYLHASLSMLVKAHGMSPLVVWCYSSARVAQLPGIYGAMVRMILSKSLQRQAVLAGGATMHSLFEDSSIASARHEIICSPPAAAL